MDVETKRRMLSKDLNRNATTKILVDKPKKPAGRGVCKFKVKSLDTHKWLMMGDEGGYCIICKLFCPSSQKPRVESAFTSKPFLGFSRKESYSDHEKTKYHIHSVELSKAFLRVAAGEKPSVKTMVAGKTRQFFYDRTRLSSVVKVIISLGKQGLALRGHRYETLKDEDVPNVKVVNAQEIVLGDTNRGNFLQSIKDRADAGDTYLLKSSSQRSKYLSPMTQNELLGIISTQIKESIVNTIVKTKSPFTIIADETTDVACSSQLCLAVRYISSDDVIQERFISFVQLTSMTGEYHYNYVVPEFAPALRPNTAEIPPNLHGKIDFLPIHQLYKLS